MDELVEARVRELDEAHARLAEQERSGSRTEEVLRRRVEELETPCSGSRRSWPGAPRWRRRWTRRPEAIAPLFGARYARVRLTALDEEQESASDEAAPPSRRPRPLSPPPWTARRRTSSSARAPSSPRSSPTWPGLSAETRERAGEDGVGAVLAAPLVATSGPAGALVIARDAPAAPFSADERQLASTIGEALAAVVEIDRLHRRETRQAAAEERQALARDLHDAVTQSIYSATLIAEALPAVYERDPAEGLHNLERLRRLVRAALAEMRTLLFELRPAALETAPLDALLERLGDALAGQTDVDVDVQVAEDLDLPPDVKIALYRVTQEAFSNIAKHARATAVTARVALDGDGGVTLTVTDDGRGFDPAAVPSGMGLHIMRERLESVGGGFAVESAPGRGTTITAVWRQPASDRPALERMGA